MPTQTVRRVRPGAIALKHREYGRLCAYYGLTSDAEVARAFGITRQSARRVRVGDMLPAERFISGALRAWKGVRFEQIFEPVDYVPRNRGAA